jgi:hypothetical protein
MHVWNQMEALRRQPGASIYQTDERGRLQVAERPYVPQSGAALYFDGRPAAGAGAAPQRYHS